MTILPQLLCRRVCMYYLICNLRSTIISSCKDWPNCNVLWKQETLKSTSWMEKGRSHCKHCRPACLQPGVLHPNQTLQCLYKNGLHDMVIKAMQSSSRLHPIGHVFGLSSLFFVRLLKCSYHLCNLALCRNAALLSVFFFHNALNTKTFSSRVCSLIPNINEAHTH